jgi:phage repressor protein C with HTH and peptisase S24 domain
LAKAFNVPIDTFLDNTKEVPLPPQRESPEELLERYRLVSPVSVPVYPEFTLHAGTGVEVVDYVYLGRTRGVSKNIEAYIIQGDCLTPFIDPGDIVIVDREVSPDNGDLIVCLVNGEVHVSKYHVEESGAFLENRFGSRKLEDCQAHAVVLEVIKKVKKNYRWQTD